jgi:hypothetical protein
MQSKMIYMALACFYCKFIRLRNHVHSSFDQSYIARFSINSNSCQIANSENVNSENVKIQNVSATQPTQTVLKVHAPSINIIDMMNTLSGNNIMLLLLILCEKQSKTCMVLIPMLQCINCGLTYSDVGVLRNNQLL